MKQILVASDFSQSALDALLYALPLAKALKMEIAVIHAIHPTEGIQNSTYNAIFIEDYYSRKRAALQEWVNPHVAKADYQDIPVTTVCVVGALRAVINQYIEYNNVSFLVMGITGATGITGIVGSNASMAVSKLRIPTLIVPQGSVPSSRPVLTLATDYKTTKFSIKDKKAMTQLLKIAPENRLEVIHIWEKDTDPEELKSDEQKLQQMLPTAQMHFHYIEEDVQTVRGIVDFVTKNETDILCLVKRDHNVIYRLFGSGTTVNQLINKSVKAVLVLHE